MYIDGRPKASRNVAGFINSTWLGTTHKLPNFIFEGHEANRVFVCTTKSLVAGEELLIDYNLNWIDVGISITGVIILYNIWINLWSMNYYFTLPTILIIFTFHF